MTPRTPAKTSRRSRATAKLSSWLNAVRIPHEPERCGGLLVKSKDGVTVLVVVTEGAPVAPGALPVDLENFWSRDMAVALEAFHTVTQALGYGMPQPVPTRARPATSDLTHHDYWMRHTEVAVSPNPDPEVFKRYKPIIDARVRRFCSNSNNRNLLWEIGMDEDDIRAIAMTWIVSYECLHKVLLSTNHDNEKLLQSYLEQRLAELHGRMNLMTRDAGYRLMTEDSLNNYLEEQSIEMAPQYAENSDSGLAVLDEANGFRERKKMSNGLLRTALKKMPKSIAIQKLEDIATRPGVEDVVSAKAVEMLARMTKSRKNVRSDVSEA